MAKAKKAKKEPTPRAWKVMSRVTEKVSDSVATKLVDASWRTATGKNPPKNADSPQVSLRESVAWTVLSTAGIAVVKSLATRRAASYFERSTGALPPALRIPSEPPAHEEITQPQ